MSNARPVILSSPRIISVGLDGAAATALLCKAEFGAVAGAEFALEATNATAAMR
jgi:hypothetical protein